jgi:predicted transporter
MNIALQSVILLLALLSLSDRSDFASETLVSTMASLGTVFVILPTIGSAVFSRVVGEPMSGQVPRPPGPR